MYAVMRQLTLTLLNLLQLAMLVRALMSWIPSLRGSGLQQALYQMTEPLIIPVRKVLERFFPAVRSFPLDLSFLATWLLIDLLMALV